MLSPGNVKLGLGCLIWSFSLPSRLTCPGRSPVCERHCYSARFERRRPSVCRRYEGNWALSRPDFPKRVVAFIRRQVIGVVRIHVGGDFYSAAYARKWLAVMRRLPGVRFFCYTRSWRVAAIRRMLSAMARLANVRLWYSADRDTGAPRRVPRGVRVAWLMEEPGDHPPRADLVFRVHALRRLVQKWVPWRPGVGRALVCPVENGVTGHRTTCGQCGVCWRPPPEEKHPMIGLPMIGARQSGGTPG
jgi:hypothetical protein